MIVAGAPAIARPAVQARAVSVSHFCSVPELAASTARFSTTFGKDTSPAR